MKKIVKLMADYGCYPVWEYEDGQLVGDLNPAHLPISEDLINQLDQWSTIYESTLCMDDPKESGFKVPEDEEKFKLWGVHLAKTLSLELGEDYEVIDEV